MVFKTREISVLVPFLPLIPDNLNGAYERFVSFLLVIWLNTVSYELYNFQEKE